MYSKNEKERDNFKIGNMFMITWPCEEVSRRRRKDDEYQDAFKCVKLSGLTLEGGVWNDKFQLEDNPEKMVQGEGFNLKITFYSQESAKGGKFAKALQTDKDLGMEKDDESKKMKQLLEDNTKESDKRIMVPI